MFGRKSKPAPEPSNPETCAHEDREDLRTMGSRGAQPWRCRKCGYMGSGA